MNVGDQVYYQNNGPDDTGKIIEVDAIHGSVAYVVKWDDGEIDTYELGQLALVTE